MLSPTEERALQLSRAAGMLINDTSGCAGQVRKNAMDLADRMMTMASTLLAPAEPAPVLPLPTDPTDREIGMRLEYNELAGRIERLAVFIGTDTYKSLDPMEQARLTLQRSAMAEYQLQLGNRIRAMA